MRKTRVALLAQRSGGSPNAPHQFAHTLPDGVSNPAQCITERTTFSLEGPDAGCLSSFGVTGDNMLYEMCVKPRWGIKARLPHLHWFAIPCRRPV